MGHKDIAYIVPLNTARTYLSLYSFVDLTFCITCPPTTLDSIETKTRLALRNASEARGTNVFVFKVKCRTRAFDWIWKLWYAVVGCFLLYNLTRDHNPGDTLEDRFRLLSKFATQAWMSASSLKCLRRF